MRRNSKYIVIYIAFFFFFFFVALFMTSLSIYHLLEEGKKTLSQCFFLWHAHTMHAHTHAFTWPIKQLWIKHKCMALNWRFCVPSHARVKDSNDSYNYRVVWIFMFFSFTLHKNRCRYRRRCHIENENKWIRMQQNVIADMKFI